MTSHATEEGEETSSPQPAEDWIQALVRNFQDKLTGGLYEAIYLLDDRSQDRLMECQAHTCVAAFVNLTGLPVPMDLDSFLKAMSTTGPSQVKIEREGNIIHWTELHSGQCVCPFVSREVIRLTPTLCICGAHWVKQLFETAANTRVEVETVETVATGSENCRFRITVLGESQPSEAPSA